MFRKYAEELSAFGKYIYFLYTFYVDTKICVVCQEKHIKEITRDYIFIERENSNGAIFEFIYIYFLI